MPLASKLTFAALALAIALGGCSKARGTLDEMSADAAYQRHDYATAFVTYSRLAQAGDAHAWAQLGVMYALGDGGAPDQAQALRCFHTAAERGDARAMASIAIYYAGGEGGVTQDNVQAYMWNDMAAASHVDVDVQAAKARDALAAKMTPAQIAQAKAMEVAWRAAHPSASR